MSNESELQKEWRDIVINKLDRIEADQKAVQLQLANSVAMASDVRHLQTKLTSLENSIREDYVTKNQYATVERIVYGVTTVTLLAIVGAVITLVLKR